MRREGGSGGCARRCWTARKSPPKNSRATAADSAIGRRRRGFVCDSTAGGGTCVAGAAISRDAADELASWRRPPKRRALLSRRLRRPGDEPVSLPGHGLDHARPLGIVPQGVADLSDGAVDAVVGVEVDVLAPDPFHDLVASHEPSPLLDEEEQQLHGDTLELDGSAAPAQLVGTRVEGRVLADLQKALGFRRHIHSGGGRHSIERRGADPSSFPGLAESRNLHAFDRRPLLRSGLLPLDDRSSRA